MTPFLSGFLACALLVAVLRGFRSQSRTYGAAPTFGARTVIRVMRGPR